MVADLRKKIVFLISSMKGGGAERVFVTLLRHLDRRHFKLYLVLLNAEGEFMCQLPKDVVVYSLLHERHPLSLPSSFFAMRKLIQVIRKIKPHAVFSTGGMNLALVLARPGLPRGTRVLIRECSVLSARLSNEARHPRLWRSLYRYLYQSADKVICQSDSMVTEMSEHFHLSRQRSMRIYNPVDIELVQELGKTGENPYSGLGPHLVAVGRFSHEKGFDLLLDAMPVVIQCLPTARLTILGQGPLKRALAEQIQRLGLAESVILAGFQQNPWPYLYHANLFVLSSRRECCSNALLEALVLDTPAVAVDCPGAMREICERNPAVRIVPAQDAAGFANEIISAYWASGYEKISAQLSAECLAKFALKRVINEYNTLFMQ